MSKRNKALFKRTSPAPQQDTEITTAPETGEVFEDNGITDGMLSDLPPGYSLDAPLSAKEKKRLAELEAFILDNLKTFYDVGAALREICDRRLYRETHTTFADYISDKYDYQRAHGYRLIESANVVDNINEIEELQNVSHGRHSNSQNVAHGRHSNLIPQNERQARTLAKYPPEKQREIWIEAIKGVGDGRITAAHIRKTASTLGLEKVKKAVKSARKPASKSPKMSRSFRDAYHGFLDAINAERETEWKDTDPKPAIQAIKVILQALEAEL